MDARTVGPASLHDGTDTPHPGKDPTKRLHRDRRHVGVQHLARLGRGGKAAAGDAASGDSAHLPMWCAYLHVVIHAELVRVSS